MDQSILENLSARKLIIICVTLLSFLLVCFLLGGLIAPSPASTEIVVATICVDNTTQHAANQQPVDLWLIPDQSPGLCHQVDSVADLFGLEGRSQPHVTAAHQVVFVFQMPRRRDNQLLDFSRWQQSLHGVLQVDMLDHVLAQHYDDDGIDEQQPVSTAARYSTPLNMHASLYYKTKRDANTSWTRLAEAVITRHMECVADSHAHLECLPVPLFQLGSLHYDYYLLNLRLLPADSTQALPAVPDTVTLVSIFSNGGFTRVWLALKLCFLPIVCALTVWFWRRVSRLTRPPSVLEYALLWLATSLTLLNVPVELLSLCAHVPAMALLCDVREGVFYAILFAFWLVFAGEHVQLHEPAATCRHLAHAEVPAQPALDATTTTITTTTSTQHSGLLPIRYWRHLASVMVGCACMLVFDICERGLQLANPFYTLWSSRQGYTVAGVFLLLAACACLLYLCVLARCVYRALTNFSSRRASLSAMSAVRRLHYEGLIYRFRLVMVLTLVAALLTVAGYCLSQVSEMQWQWLQPDESADLDEEEEEGAEGGQKWRLAPVGLEYTSAMFCGVYGLWNVYTILLVCMYAPSCKRRVLGCGDSTVGIVGAGTSRLSLDDNELSTLATPVGEHSQSDMIQLANFATKLATD